MRQQYIHVSTEGRKEEKDSAACKPVTQRETEREGGERWRIAANPQPHSQNRRTATTYYLKTREKKKNQGIPQNLQQEEGGPTTESSARYLSEISHASHGGINPLFLTLRRESEEAGVSERAQEAGERRIERASPPPRRCCCRRPPPPSPPLLQQHHPEPSSGEIDGLLLTVHAAVRSCFSDRQESGAS
ncbi:hypothetical protein E1301_Tti008804 [Triplophysa tibetana]|uniref:Uncharacterized protein n=1 Tax=Triplophysa tibetana TaxID=1572043 RepID=A0A5A9P0P0_9TELE|nr:hypothetical protein E1301_Tti008804 [Triplophysa tibetana]